MAHQQSKTFHQLQQLVANQLQAEYCEIWFFNGLLAGREYEMIPSNDLIADIDNTHFL